MRQWKRLCLTCVSRVTWSGADWPGSSSGSGEGARRSTETRRLTRAGVTQQDNISLKHSFSIQEPLIKNIKNKYACMLSNEIPRSQSHLLQVGFRNPWLINISNPWCWRWSIDTCSHWRNRLRIDTCSHWRSLTLRISWNSPRFLHNQRYTRARILLRIVDWFWCNLLEQIKLLYLI